VRPAEEGQASGASGAIRELGGVFGVAVLASICARQGSYLGPQSFVDGMVPAVLIGAIVVAFGAAVAFTIPHRVPGDQTAAVQARPAATGPTTASAPAYARIEDQV
jgi:hypothetical protein